MPSLWRARIGAVLAFLPACLMASGPGTSGPDIQELFHAYSTGHQTTAILAVLDQRITSATEAETYYAELRGHIDGWPREPAAAFALESAWAALFAEAAKPGELEAHSHFGDMVDLGCAALRRSAATPFDRPWYLAAIALLTGPPSDMPGGSTLASLHPAAPRVAALDGLSAQLRERFPADPALSLAWGTSREAEVQAWLYSWATSMRLQPDRPIPKQPRTEDAHRWLDDAASAFEIARQDSAFRAEATLRLGLTTMYQGGVDNALKLWSGIPALGESAPLRYLSYMFTGRTLGALGRRADAIAAYRQAAALRPGAQSVRIPLAALLYLSGDRDEAARLVSPLMSATAAAADPWWGYTDEHVQERISAMRRAMPR